MYSNISSYNANFFDYKILFVSYKQLFPQMSSDVRSLSKSIEAKKWFVTMKNNELC